MKNNKTAEIVKPFGDYRTPGPNQKVIELLRKTLAEAERGEIVSVAISAINSCGCVNVRAESGSRGMCELVGSVTFLQNDLLQNWKYDTDDVG